jgi:hypothetical protein
LDLAGTVEDLTRLGIDLEEGKQILLYDEDADRNGVVDDLVAIGKVSYDSEERRWVAEVSWDDVKHVSELPPDQAEAYRVYRPTRRGQPE